MLNEITQSTIQGVYKQLRFVDKVKSQADFGRALGWSRSFTSLVLGGHEKVPKDFQLKVLQAFPEAQSIMDTLEAESMKAKTGKPIDTIRVVPADNYMVVPYLPASARGGSLVSSIADPEYLETLPTILLPREHDKADRLVIDMVGHSMDDGTIRAICDGDKLLIRRMEMGLYRPPQQLQYKRYLFCIEPRGDVPVVKQVIEHNVERGMVLCHSFNPAPEFDDYPVFLNDVRSLWYVERFVDRPIIF